MIYQIERKLRVSHNSFFEKNVSLVPDREIPISLFHTLMFFSGTISTSNEDEEFSDGHRVTKRRAALTDEIDLPDEQFHHPDPLITSPRIQWDLLRLPTIGLSNDGENVYYINAAIQCLASTPPLVESILPSSANDRTPNCK
jgi:ubiquitin C-terminal hydrolase